MSYTPNDFSQWTSGGDESLGYPVTTTAGYDLSQIPVTTAAMATAGMDMASSAALFNPMFSYAGASADAGSFDSYYQYNVDGATLDHEGQPIYNFDQDTEGQDAQGSNEEGSSKKKGKKRPPRNYTAEQLAKRREQNRKAQRTYRDRKDQRIKELEEQLAAASQQTEMISSAIDALKTEHAALTGSSSGTRYPSSSYGAYPPASGI